MVHWFMVGFMMKKVQIISLRLRVRNYPIIHLLVNLPSIVLPGRDRQHQIYVKFQGKTSWPGFADMMPLLYIIIGPSKEVTDDHQLPNIKSFLIFGFLSRIHPGSSSVYFIQFESLESFKGKTVCISDPKNLVIYQILLAWQDWFKMLSILIEWYRCLYWIIYNIR